MATAYVRRAIEIEFRPAGGQEIAAPPLEGQPTRISN
jgi:hypothetical protein